MQAPIWSTLCLLFAWSVDALPRNSTFGREANFPISPIHTLLGRNAQSDRYSILCDPKERTLDNWINLRMGPLLKMESDLFFGDGPCFDGPYGPFGDKTFIEAIQSKLVGVAVAGKCDMTSCAEPSFSTDTCREGENSTWMFFLTVLSNYVRWITKMQAAVSDGTTMIDETIAIVSNRFSTPAVTSVNWRNGITIIVGGIIGGIAAAMGPALPYLATMLGVVGGGVGIGVGIINSGRQNVETLKVQEQLNRQATLQATLYEMHQVFNGVLDHWGTDLVEKPPSPPNDPWNDSWYADNEWSLPAVLASGDFVTEKDFDKKKFATMIQRHFIAAGISWVWRQERAFIVKLKGDIISQSKAKGGCALESDLADWDVKLYCKDDVAYFMVLDSEIDQGFVKLSPPHGLDDLKIWDFTYEQVIDTSITTQKLYGFPGDRSKDETLDDFETDADDQPVFSVPICDLDSLPNREPHIPNSIIKYKYLTAPIALFHLLRDCMNTKDDMGNKFPYDLVSY